MLHGVAAPDLNCLLMNHHTFYRITCFFFFFKPSKPRPCKKPCLLFWKPGKRRQTPAQNLGDEPETHHVLPHICHEFTRCQMFTIFQHSGVSTYFNNFQHIVSTPHFHIFSWHVKRLQETWPMPLAHGVQLTKAVLLRQTELQANWPIPAGSLRAEMFHRSFINYSPIIHQSFDDLKIPEELDEESLR